MGEFGFLSALVRLMPEASGSPLTMHRPKIAQPSKARTGTQIQRVDGRAAGRH